MSEFARIHHQRMGEVLVAAQRAATLGEVPVGAALYHHDELLWTAFNMMEASGDHSAHAEMMALRRLSDLTTIDHRKLTLYVTLEPCPMCAGAIILWRVGTVVWGADDPRYGAAGSAFRVLGEGLPQPQPILISGVREDECRVLLKDFFQELRHRK